MFRWTGGTRARAYQRTRDGEDYCPLAPILPPDRRGEERSAASAGPPTASKEGKEGEMKDQVRHEESSPPPQHTSPSAAVTPSCSSSGTGAASTTTAAQASRVLLRAMVAAREAAAEEERVGTYASHKRARTREREERARQEPHPRDRHQHGRRRRRRHLSADRATRSLSWSSSLSSRSTGERPGVPLPPQHRSSLPVPAQSQQRSATTTSTCHGGGGGGVREAFAQQLRRQQRVRHATGAGSLDCLALRWPRPPPSHGERDRQRSSSSNAPAPEPPPHEDGEATREADTGAARPSFFEDHPLLLPLPETRREPSPSALLLVDELGAVHPEDAFAPPLPRDSDQDDALSMLLLRRDALLRSGEGDADSQSSAFAAYADRHFSLRTAEGGEPPWPHQPQVPPPLGCVSGHHAPQQVSADIARELLLQDEDGDRRGYVGGDWGGTGSISDDGYPTDGDTLGMWGNYGPFPFGSANGGWGCGEEGPGDALMERGAWEGRARGFAGGYHSWYRGDTLCADPLPPAVCQDQDAGGGALFPQPHQQQHLVTPLPQRPSSGSHALPWSSAPPPPLLPQPPQPQYRPMPVYAQPQPWQRPCDEQQRQCVQIQRTQQTHALASAALAACGGFAGQEVGPVTAAAVAAMAPSARHEGHRGGFQGSRSVFASLQPNSYHRGRSRARKGNGGGGTERYQNFLDRCRRLGQQ